MALVYTHTHTHRFRDFLIQYKCKTVVYREKARLKNSQFERRYTPRIIDRKWPWRKRKVLLWHVPCSNLFVATMLLNQALAASRNVTCTDNLYYSNAWFLLLLLFNFRHYFLHHCLMEKSFFRTSPPGSMNIC